MTEFVSPEGFRLDGRSLEQVRKIKFYETEREESAVRIGDTIVIAKAYGPSDQLKSSDCPISCSVNCCPFSSGRRINRKTVFPNFQSTISKSLNSLLHVSEEDQRIHIDITILQMDGSVLAAAINAAVVALVRNGIPLRDLMVAVSAGCKNGDDLIDLNHDEENGDGAYLTVGFVGKKKNIGCLVTESRTNIQELKSLISKSADAANALSESMRLYLVNQAAQDSFKSLGE